MSADNRHRTTNARALPRKDTNDEAYTTPSTATHRTRQCKDAIEKVSPTTTTATTKDCGVITQDTSANDKLEKESVDHSKTEALAEKIDRHLTTTLHGEFFEGTKSSNAARHMQLPEIFALRGHLQERKASEKKDRHGNDDQEPGEAKASSRTNANMLAAIKSIVAEQLNRELRDMKIENERLNERIVKSEKEKAELEMKVISLEAKARKNERPGCTQVQYQAMQGRLNALEKESNRAPCTPEEYHALLRRVADMEAAARSTSTVSSHEQERISALEIQVETSSAGLFSLKQSVDGQRTLVSHATALARNAQSQVAQLSGRITGNEEQVFSLKQRVESFGGDLEEIQEWGADDQDSLEAQRRQLQRIESQKIPANVESIQQLEGKVFNIHRVLCTVAGCPTVAYHLACMGVSIPPLS